MQLNQNTKQTKKKKKSCGTLEELIETITQNNIQFGNLIFYNFNITAIKKKLKDRNLQKKYLQIISIVMPQNLNQYLKEVEGLINNGLN